MEEVQKQIDEKNGLCEAYRQKCDQCWLLMITDRYNPPQAFQPGFYESLRQQFFSCAFDRAFVLEVCPCHEELIELKKFYDGNSTS